MRRHLLFLLLLTATLQAQQPAFPSAPAAQPSPAARGYRIAGTVIGLVSSQPVADASVSITATANPAPSITMQTGPDGRFVFLNVSRGKYLLIAKAKGYSPQGLDEHGDYATAVAVGPELDAEHIVLRLRPDAAIEGRVTDEHNEPVANASVQLFRKGMYRGAAKIVVANQMQTDEDGYYHIEHCSPGTYYVAVSARPWYAQNYDPAAWKGLDAETAVRVAQEAKARDVAYPLTFYPGVEDSSGATPINLHPGGQFTADVVMRAVPAARLRIHFPEPERKEGEARSYPMFFQRISQRIFDGYLDQAIQGQGTSAQPGVLEILGVAPGDYVIQMEPNRFNEKFGIKPGAGWYEEINVVGDMDLQAAEAPRMGTISGAVTYEGSSAPAPGRTFIELANRESGERWSSEVDDKGLFGIKDNAIRPGTYEALLSGQTGYVIRKLSARGAKVSGGTIVITPGASVQVVCTAIRATAQIDGTVVRDDNPVSGAMVVLVPQDVVEDWVLVRRDQSDSDGTFTLPNVVPGQYTVVAIVDGWDLEWGKPSVIAPYRKRGTPVQVPSDGKLNIKVQALSAGVR